MNLEIGDFHKQLRIVKKALEPEEQLTLPEGIESFMTEVAKRFRTSADTNLLTPILGKLAQNCATDMHISERNGEATLHIHNSDIQETTHMGRPKNFTDARKADKVVRIYADLKTEYIRCLEKGTTLGLYEVERIWELSLSMHEKYGKVLPDLQRAMHYWLAEKNEGSAHDQHINAPRSRNEIENITEEALLDTIGTMQENHKDAKEEMAKGTLAYIQSGYMRGTHHLQEPHRKIDKIVRLLAQNPEMQKGALRSLEVALLGPEMGGVDNLLAHSWRTLEETEEITEYDWNSSLLHTEILTNIGNSQKKNALEKELKKHMQSEEKTATADELDDLMREIEEIENAIAINKTHIQRTQKFLQENKKPSKRRKLHEKIGCDAIRSELTKIQQMHAWDVLASKEKEAIARIYSAIAEYTFMNQYDTVEETQQKSYITGTPRSVAETKSLNCFSSMWLFAAMLMKCGIEHNRILFCNVLENTVDDQKTFGSHAALVILLSNGKKVLVDNGYHHCAVDFPLEQICSEHQYNQFSKMRKDPQQEYESVAQQYTSPLNISIPKDISKRFSGYEEIQLMEIQQAFGSMHMTNTAIDFEEQGEKECAAHAYKMSLYYNPKNPDALFRLGKLAYEKGDTERAEEYFDATLNEGYDQHLITIYFQGLIAMKKEEWTKAKELFTQVANDDRRIWGDRRFKDIATQFADLSIEQLQKVLHNKEAT